MINLYNKRLQRININYMLVSINQFYVAIQYMTIFYTKSSQNEDDNWRLGSILKYI